MNKVDIIVSKVEATKDGINYIIKTKTGNYHDLYVVYIDLDKEMFVNILKHKLGEPRNNLWIAMVLFLKDIEPIVYLIPSEQFAQPDDYIFIHDEVSEPFEHLSTWKIKVFISAIPKLSKFSLRNMIQHL